MSRGFWVVSARELRSQLLILATVFWTLAAINTLTPGTQYRSGQVKGADFLHFYVLGTLAAEGRTSLLFDADAQRVEQERLVPASKGTWFVPIYGPQTALMFSVFARLPYLRSAGVWAGLTVVLYALCVWAIWNCQPSLRQHRCEVMLAAAAFPPFYSLVQHGQTSVVPLVFFTLAYMALRADRPWLAGLALGSVVFKPQLGIAITVLALARRQWRLIGGAVVAIAVQWGLPVLLWGAGPLLEYFAMLRLGPRLAALLEPKVYQLHSLRGFWTLLCGHSLMALVAYLLTSVLAIAAAVRMWRHDVAVESRYSALLLATVLVDPHVGLYDLVVLAPAFLLTAGEMEAAPDSHRRRLRAITYVAFCATLVSPLAAVTHVQVSVPVLAAWLLYLHSAVNRARRAAMAGLAAPWSNGGPEGRG